MISPTAKVPISGETEVGSFVVSSQEVVGSGSDLLSGSDLSFKSDDVSASSDDGFHGGPYLVMLAGTPGIWRTGGFGGISRRPESGAVLKKAVGHVLEH